jgi:hypothetical protein
MAGALVARGLGLLELSARNAKTGAKDGEPSSDCRVFPLSPGENNFLGGIASI